MKFICSLTSLAVLVVVVSSLVVHDRDSSAEVQKREIHEVEGKVVKREVTEEDVSNVCPNCSIGFVCCPGINVSTCCEQDEKLSLRDSSLFLAMSPFAFKDRLKAGESLTVDQSINSQNSKYFLVMQGDGNLVLYQRVIVPVWSTGTSNTGAKVAVMQADENFVVYDGNGIARWNSGTGGFHDPGCALVVQNDGNLVIYESTGRVVWTR